MKLYKQLIFILILFIKTETLFSENNLFSVNNIQLKKNNEASNIVVDQAIKKGFNELISKILLKDDRDKLLDLNLSSIKQLVTYYQIANISDEEEKKRKENAAAKSTHQQHSGRKQQAHGNRGIGRRS